MINWPELGMVCLSLTLGLAVLQTIAGIWNTAAGAALARRAAVLNVCTLSAVFAAMIWAAVVSDFSVAVVALYSHTDKPLLYKISGVWGNHEGSMVLWAWILSLYGLAISRLESDERLRQLALGVQGALLTAFVAFILVQSNPLARLDPAPLQGQSLNPLLQDPALAFHPPFLYAGYVGFSAVFALGIAGLIRGRVDADWARAVRPLALMAWVCLGIGIAMGSYWAYYELGWGGWWFWDPVENASLLPWLAGTALLHALLITEKRGLFPGWSVFLALIAFSMALLGTFLVRSGVLTSVHAFALDPARGYSVLAIFAVFAGGGFTLFALRGAHLSDRPPPFALLSREGLMMINNLILTAMSFAVLIGTLYPLLLEGLTGRSLSVGAPYFNAVFLPLMALLLFALPVGLILPWRKGRLALLRHLIPAMSAAMIVFVAGLWLLGPANAFAALGLALCGWVAAASIWDYRLRTQSTPQRLRPAAILLAHLGLAVMGCGAVLETTGRADVTAQLTVGQSVTLGRHTLKLEAVGEVEGPNYTALRGILRDPVTGRAFQPERRFYPISNQSTTEAAIEMHPWGDVYVTLGEPQNDAQGQTVWPVRLAVHPWVTLIYLGVTMMAIGGLLAFATRRRGREL